jgi:hypothetical protein
MYAAVVASAAAAAINGAGAAVPTPVMRLPMLSSWWPLPPASCCRSTSSTDATLTLSLATVPLSVGLYTLTPGQLIVADVLGSIIALSIRRLPPFKAAVNVAGFWLEWVVATTVFAAFQPHGYGPSTWIAVLVAALAADACQAVVLAGAITIFLGRPEPGLLRTQLIATAAVAVDTCVAFVAVTLLVTESAAALLFSVIVDGAARTVHTARVTAWATRTSPAHEADDRRPIGR